MPVIPVLYWIGIAAVVTGFLIGAE